MFISFPLLKSIAVPLLFLFSVLAHAEAEVSLNKNGHAVEGYDPVSYFTEDEPKPGDEQFSAEYEGATYLFASAENRDLFVSDPAKYVPQYGGFCAFGASLGKKYPIDPQSWRIEDGKLYLNSSPKAHTMWLEDVPGRVETADGLWSTIRDKSPAEIN